MPAAVGIGLLKEDGISLRQIFNLAAQPNPIPGRSELSHLKVMYLFKQMEARFILVRFSSRLLKADSVLSQRPVNMDGE